MRTARLLLEALDAVLMVWPADRVGLDARNIAFIFARESLDRGDRRIGRDVRRLFKAAYILNEGLTKESAEIEIQRGHADAPAFGRPFIANPDLVERFRRGVPLNSVNPQTTYTDDESGYNDYLLLDEGTAGM